MTKKAIWNKETEEFLAKVIGMGATAAQASEELFNKFDMVFSRNSIISKVGRMDVEFMSCGRNKYILGTINYSISRRQKTVDTSAFIKEWENGTSIAKMSEMFDIKHSSVLEKARRLKLKKRDYDPSFLLKRKSFSLKGDGVKEAPVKFNRKSFPNPSARSVSFEDLDYRGCRFVIGDGAAKDFLFCGARVPDGSDVPYCEHCRPIVYVRPVVKSVNLVRNVNVY